MALPAPVAGRLQQEGSSRKTVTSLKFVRSPTVREGKFRFILAGSSALPSLTLGLLTGNYR
jgi:hypothetical protein